MATSRFVDVTQEVIIAIEETIILRSTRDATRFGVTLFKDKI